MAKSTNPAAPFTSAIFAATCLLGAGAVASCEVRATGPGQCLESYGVAAFIVGAGATQKATNEVGFRTDNPALDGIRKSRILEELEVEAKTEGPPVEPPPEPDWLAEALEQLPPEPEEVLPVWVDDAPIPPLEDVAAEPDEDSLPKRMARAAAKLQHQKRA